MGRKNTKALDSIRNMCASHNLDMDVLYGKSKLLLKIYRDICWSTGKRADLLREETSLYCGSELSTALIYLSEFAPDEERQRFESKVRNLFETEWMIELIDNAMLRVYDYYNNGRLYHEILSKCFLTSFRYTESEMLELLNMERSVFYDRKKEATMLFGVALWGFAVPQLQGLIDADDMELRDDDWEEMQVDEH